MFNFLSEYTFVLLMLTLYGFIGGFVLIPLRNNIRYVVLAAPMAGMLLWTMGVFLLYSFANFSVKNAALLIGVGGISVTLVGLLSLKSKIKFDSGFFTIILILIYAAIITFLMTSGSRSFGHSGFLFVGGSDHLGYAAMADWLNSHLINQAPIANGDAYQSFPALLMGRESFGYTLGDPRFGSFFNLSIISMMFGRSSTFSYDIACAIVLTTSFLGIASLLSQKRTVLVLLLIALSTSFLFILSRTGYFGKLMGFSSILYIIGLFFILESIDSNKDSSFNFIVLLILTLAAAMTYPGFLLATILLIVGAFFLLFKLIKMNKNLSLSNLINLRNKSALLVIMILISLSAPGYLSTPKQLYNITPITLEWFNVILHQFDLRYINPYVHLDLHSLYLFFIVTAFVGLVGFFIIILLKRDAIAGSMIGSSLFLLVIPLISNDKWLAYELSGLIYPLSICGCGWYLGHNTFLFNTKSQKMLVYILYLIITSSIVLRFSSFKEALNSYSANVPSAMQFSKKEMDKLAKFVKTNNVIIDIPDRMFALPILVEFGRRNINLQWTAAAWKAVVGYRTWLPPTLQSSNMIIGLNPATLTMFNLMAVIPKGCKEMYTTRQYVLLNCDSKKWDNAPITYQKI